MGKQLIISVGREFGSGGREVGRRLAERLNIAYYDREIIDELMKGYTLKGKVIKYSKVRVCKK